MCNRVSGCAPKGSDDDMCLATDFAAREGLAGICQISAQDALGEINDGNLVESYLTRSMGSHFASFLNHHLKPALKTLNSWNNSVEERLKPVNNALKAYENANAALKKKTAEFKRDHKAEINAATAPFDDQISKLQEEIESIEAKLE